MKAWMVFLFLLSPLAEASAPPPPLNIYISQSPLLQGQGFAIFVSDPNVSGHPAITLSATVDGTAVNLVNPTSGLWAYNGSPYGMIATHTFAVSISESNAVVGTQSFNFNVQYNPANTFVPQVSSLTPNIGSNLGGTTVLIKGANFVPGASVKINGTPTSTSFVDANDLLIVTPNFQGAVGAASVEVDLPTNGTSDAPNVFLPAAFYISSQAPGAFNIPVAIVSNPRQTVSASGTVNLDGHTSYDLNGFGIRYQWRFLLTPANSKIALGSKLANSALTSFVADVPGTFVVGLVVRELGGSGLESNPELAVITVNPMWLDFIGNALMEKRF